MEAFENRLSQASARVQSKVRTERLTVYDPKTNETTRMKSSWIRSFAYDNRTQKLYMTVHTGKTYSWDNIDPMMASQILRGDASCTTEDPTGKRRWWISKNPSLGAAFWQYLKNFSGGKTTNPFQEIAAEVAQAITAQLGGTKFMSFEPLKHDAAIREERAAHMRAGKMRPINIQAKLQLEQMKLEKLKANPNTDKIQQKKMSEIQRKIALLQKQLKELM